MGLFLFTNYPYIYTMYPIITYIDTFWLGRSIKIVEMIKSEDEYAKALNDLEIFLDDTEKNEECKILVDEITAYEDDHYPIPKITDETYERCKKELCIKSNEG